MTGEYRMDGLAVPESLEQLHELLERVRRDHPDVDETALMMFETAVVEIHGNVIRHGRPRGKVSYEFRLEVQDDRLRAHLTTDDDEVPDLSHLHGLEPADPLAESGRGLWLAEAMLDELRYARSGNHNIWTMVKLLDTVSGDAGRP
ncbi:MAG TPA: ATP-binding protein [Propionibacteriaceae bacterium]|nr:ATP-binding protein [Propionibacteriaceae bacterium]